MIVNSFTVMGGHAFFWVGLVDPITVTVATSRSYEYTGFTQKRHKNGVISMSAPLSPPALPPPVLTVIGVRCIQYVIVAV